MAGSIFSGMEAFGLGDMSTQDIFRDPKAEEQKTKVGITATQVKVVQEEDFLFDKTYACPVCSKNFKERTLRTGKARMLKMDMDLRQVFEGIEPLKYDVVQCTGCGFTALTRYFLPMTVPQKKMILEKITPHYKPAEYKKLYSYEEAIGRYKLALVNAIVKVSKASEKAYICLRAGWLTRSYVEALEAEPVVNQAKIDEMKALETEFLKNAYEGFAGAIQAESYPMCGMDESTVEYLLATLAIRFKHIDVASKLISKLLVSPNCNSRTKDKVRELKDELIRLHKEGQ